LPRVFRILASSTGSVRRTELRYLRVNTFLAEKKSPQIRAQRDALFAERDLFSAAPDFFPNRFLIVEEEPILIDVIDLVRAPISTARWPRAVLRMI